MKLISVLDLSKLYLIHWQNSTESASHSSDLNIINFPTANTRREINL